MHIYNLNEWRHSHRFNIDDTHGERNTKRVILLTLLMMVIEISAGYLFGSMALLADGWHMGTHAVALGITAVAYYFARKHARDRRFTFGTGKIGVLGGFSSAVVLAVVALLMAVESVERLLTPQPIRFNEAILVAVLGLVVNIISALVLQDPGDGLLERGVAAEARRPQRVERDLHRVRPLLATRQRGSMIAMQVAVVGEEVRVGALPVEDARVADLEGGTDRIGRGDDVVDAVFPVDAATTASL